MFHKAINLDFADGTVIEVTFRDGKVKQYDLAELFDKYPQLRPLENRDFFLSGRLAGHYGIVWNDDIDLEAETVYMDGKTVRTVSDAPNADIGDAMYAARAERGISQKELAVMTGIDQSDISKIERGTANPSVNTLRRIADALGAELKVSLVISDFT
ncbi:MAG: helix-turn-helix domain-containing protein [Eubacterium sp.]|nr:helix-turn-helix domain-containing protein [Eubacterium sp.]